MMASVLLPCRLQIGLTAYPYRAGDSMRMANALSEKQPRRGRYKLVSQMEPLGAAGVGGDGNSENNMSEPGRDGIGRMGLSVKLAGYSKARKSASGGARNLSEQVSGPSKLKSREFPKLVGPCKEHPGN